MSEGDQQNQGLRPVGAILQAQTAPKRSAETLPRSRQSNPATYSEIKQRWAEQVAADTKLSPISLRIALVWPCWLNRETLLAWPAQSTVAEATQSTVRSVRKGLKMLETRGHLECTSQYRGGRLSNRYRIVLQGTAVGPSIYETGTDGPGTEEQVNRSDRTTRTAQTRADQPGRAAQPDRGTPEKTHEKNNSATGAPADAHETHREPPATREQAAAILREAFGERVTNDTGFLRGK